MLFSASAGSPVRGVGRVKIYSRGADGWEIGVGGEYWELELAGELAHHITLVLYTINRWSCTIITEKAPIRAFSWLKAATTAFTFKTLLGHYSILCYTDVDPTHGK